MLQQFLVGLELSCLVPCKGVSSLLLHGALQSGGEHGEKEGLLLLRALLFSAKLPFAGASYHFPQLTPSPLSPGTPRERRRSGERLALTLTPRNSAWE